MADQTTLSENERKHTSSNPLRQLAINRYFDTVDALMPPVATAINAGCGEGFDAQRLKKKRPELNIIGTDISFEAVQKARQICPSMPVCVGDVTRPPFASPSADIVISLEVLEHLETPEDAVKAYKNLTRRYLLLGVPNEPLFRLLRMASGMNIGEWGDHPEHVQHWNIFSFTRFLQQHHLHVLKTAVPFPFIWTIALCELETPVC